MVQNIAEDERVKGEELQRDICVPLCGKERTIHFKFLTGCNLIRGSCGVRTCRDGNLIKLTEMTSTTNCMR